MEKKYHQAVGRRKTAIAQVRIFPGGNGTVTVNGKDIKEYFKTESQVEHALNPLQATGKTDVVDITVRTVGGGLPGQSDAIRLGIARGLVQYDESLKDTVKSLGLLTRDPRKKERKKFGLRGARRSRQWRKR